MGFLVLTAAAQKVRKSSKAFDVHVGLEEDWSCNHCHQQVAVCRFMHLIQGTLESNKVDCPVRSGWCREHDGGEMWV